MRTKLIKIGNSKGIRLSMTLIEQFNLKEEIILEPTDNGILILPAKGNRKGWEEKFKTGVKKQEKEDEWNQAGNRFDEEEWTW